MTQLIDGPWHDDQGRIIPPPPATAPPAPVYAGPVSVAPTGVRRRISTSSVALAVTALVLAVTGAMLFKSGTTAGAVATPLPATSVRASAAVQRVAPSASGSAAASTAALNVRPPALSSHVVAKGGGSIAGGVVGGAVGGLSAPTTAASLTTAPPADHKAETAPVAAPVETARTSAAPVIHASPTLTLGHKDKTEPPPPLTDNGLSTYAEGYTVGTGSVRQDPDWKQVDATEASRECSTVTGGITSAWLRGCVQGIEDEQGALDPPSRTSWYDVGYQAGYADGANYPQFTADDFTSSCTTTASELASDGQDIDQTEFITGCVTGSLDAQNGDPSAV